MPPHLIRLFLAVEYCPSRLILCQRQINTRLKKSALGTGAGDLGKGARNAAPDVATCLENCAFLLRTVGRPEEAEPLESRARAIRAKPRARDYVQKNLLSLRGSLFLQQQTASIVS